jgi:hypothetical protein
LVTRNHPRKRGTLPQTSLASKHYRDPEQTTGLFPMLSSP